MWTSFTTLGASVLVLAILTVFLLILVAKQQRSGRDISVWFFSGVAGVLLGVAGSVAFVSLQGYELVQRSAGIPPEALAALNAAPPAGGGGTVMPDFMPGMERGASGGGGGPSGGMGGGGFGGTPSPQRQLTSLVRKIELLTSDLDLNLSAEQTAELLKQLQGLDTQESLANEDAQAKHDAILAMLSEEQKAKEQAVGLPRPQGGPRGGGEPAAPDSNPFREGPNHDALRKLNERLGGQSASPAPTAAEPAAADPAPNTQP